jgi:nucleoside phosphorylase
LREDTIKGTVFHVGQFGDWEIALAECGAGNVRAALTIERAIDYFSPEVACFVGIAGGVKDVAIGDVVVASKVYGYESGKDYRDTFEPRPEISLPAYEFDQRARAIRLKSGWTQRFDRTLSHGNAKIYVGGIAAGEKVVASLESQIAQFIRKTYGDALAVEMEGRGFLDGVYINNPVRGCVVRGISDLLDGKEKTDKAGSQAIAADAASAVVLELLATLPSSGARPASAPASPAPSPPAHVLAKGRPSTKTPAIYFEPGEVLAEFGEQRDGDRVQFTCPTGEGFYLRVIPAVSLSRPLSRAVLGSSIQEAGLFAMWRNPSGLFTQNRYGSIVVEPRSHVGGDLKALTQVFPSGELWGIARWLLVRERPQFGTFIPAKALEDVYRDVLVRYINFLSRHLRVDPPVVIKAGAVGLTGFRLAVDNDQFFGPFYDDALEETYELNDFSPESLNTVLLEYFEALYSASGHPRPKNLWNFPPRN